VVPFYLDTNGIHGKGVSQRLGETKIANSFTSNFQVVAMEANALTLLFTSF
jgi:hypothetical protein